MSFIPIQSERASRGSRVLRTALGSAIVDWPDDASVIQVMLNPDGRLWIDRLGERVSDTSAKMELQTPFADFSSAERPLDAQYSSTIGG